LLGDPRVKEVSEGVYAYIQPDGSWFINNTGFAVGPRALLASTPAPPSGESGPAWTLSTPFGQHCPVAGGPASGPPA
jgi:hypothetical protein